MCLCLSFFCVHLSGFLTQEVSNVDSWWFNLKLLLLHLNLCSRPQTRARVAANSVTPPSDSTAPPSDSGTVGNTDVLEVEEDVPVGSKRKLRSEVWEEIDLIKVNVDLESRMPLV
jgi:hypothetical protein